MSVRKLQKYLARQLEQRGLNDNVECEQKYRVAAVDPLRRRLLSLGAQRQASGFERNELYDFEGRLSSQGRRLRLRRNGKKLATLTIKGPRLLRRQKTRMEVETPVNYEAAKHILKLVGFRITETYSKTREEYRLDDCAVCLDHVRNAGWFVEIEGASAKIRSIARRLGLHPADQEQRSYRRLIRDAASNKSHPSSPSYSPKSSNP